jgi:uncharacterized membrane protein (DUF441 family)
MDVRGRLSREWGIACIAIGVALALISGLAETVGIGGGTFGWKQVVGVVVGCVIALIGLFIVFGPSSHAPDTG